MPSCHLVPCRIRHQSTNGGPGSPSPAHALRSQPHRDAHAAMRGSPASPATAATSANGLLRQQSSELSNQVAAAAAGQKDAMSGSRMEAALNKGARLEEEDTAKLLDDFSNQLFQEYGHVHGELHGGDGAVASALEPRCSSHAITWPLEALIENNWSSLLAPSPASLLSPPLPLSSSRQCPSLRLAPQSSRQHWTL